MKQPIAIFCLLLVLAVTACTQTELAGPQTPAVRPGAPIGFMSGQHNAATRAQALQEAGQYNFGVFAYSDVNPLNALMDNYLVGYYDSLLAYNSHLGCSTWGDPAEQGLSYWMYEGMGYDEYSGLFAGQPMEDRYRSNCDRQHLCYWDNNSAYTSFYAYSPYINGSQTPVFDPQSSLLTIPEGTITAGYNDQAGHEVLYAANRVNRQGYSDKVALVFRRLNARVRICFWEDIEGYSVRMLDLSPDYPGIYAAAGIRNGAGTDDNPFTYLRSTYMNAAGATIDFADIDAPLAQLTTGQPTGEPLHFNLPQGYIGNQRQWATLSPTTYYAIPRDTTDSLTGMTFHVSYCLEADQGTAMQVYDATVHVPAPKAQWRANTSYTYIFRITRNTNGTSGTVPDVDPSDPNVPTGPNIFPIVFDNVTADTWNPMENEFGF